MHATYIARISDEKIVAEYSFHIPSISLSFSSELSYFKDSAQLPGTNVGTNSGTFGFRFAGDFPLDFLKICLQILDF